ncbi:MAG: sn-glycerol-3-phosphate ABC transporter ATP-binding protein UgpC [Elusimicrobiota bacterium]
MAEVKFSKISKKYGDNIILKEIDFEIKDGEFVVIVGPSGCGKTTLLRMLSGLEEVTEGDIYIDSIRVNELSPSEREIAMVFQDYALYPHMSVKENMSFALKLKKYPKDEIEKRVNEAAAILHLENLLDRMPKQLSGGQRQRVAIGRAIVRHPKVFLFDEPLSNLDAKLREEMRLELLKLYQKLNASIIYVTHDQIEAMTLASKVIIMNKGVIQQIGTPLEVYKKPKNIFVASFIGTPTMNFIKGYLVFENKKLYLSAEGKMFFIPSFVLPEFEKHINKETILGIRPDDIIIEESKIDLENKIEGIIDVVEMLGSRENIYIKLSEKKTICATTSYFSGSPLSKIYFSPNYNNIHLFDPHTQERIN